MIFARRYLVLAAVMFWQGGFTFYAAVVVHVGNEVLGSHLQQGMVTRSVTNYLNLAGAVALIMWAWDLTSTHDPRAGRRWLRWALWALLATGLGGLAWLHIRLDELIVSQQIHNRPLFHELHSWYLNISTAQWAGSLILLAATMSAWQTEDKALAA